MKVLSLIAQLTVVFFLCSCQKQIEFDLPGVEQIVVVEGKIESGQPPIVFLTTTQGYFDPIDSSTFDNIFIHNADVSVSDGVDAMGPMRVFVSMSYALPSRIAYLTF